jgi:hypothetical protein
MGYTSLTAFPGRATKYNAGIRPLIDQLNPLMIHFHLQIKILIGVTMSFGNLYQPWGLSPLSYTLTIASLPPSPTLLHHSYSIISVFILA